MGKASLHNATPLRVYASDIMYTHDANDGRGRKIAELTVGEFTSLLLKIQTEAIEKALLKVAPQRDPDEDCYMTTQEAADFIGLTRQTVQAKKSKNLIEYEGEGRTTRFTKAALKRYLKAHGTPLSVLKHAQKKNGK